MCFLKEIALFSHLENAVLQKIDAQLERHTFIKNALVFFEGQKAEKMYFVAEGRLKVFKTSEEGKEHILGIMPRKSIVGEVPMFEEGTFPAHCVAMTASVLFSIEREHFLKLIQEDPRIALKMLSFQARRLKNFIEKIEGLSLQKTEKNLVNYILKIGKFLNGYVHASMQSMNMEELAHYLGTTREHLSRAIKRLMLNNVLKKTNKNFLCLDTKVYFESLQETSFDKKLR